MVLSSHNWLLAPVSRPQFANQWLKLNVARELVKTDRDLGEEDAAVINAEVVVEAGDDAAFGAASDGQFFDDRSVPGLFHGVIP